MSILSWRRHGRCLVDVVVVVGGGGGGGHAVGPALFYFENNGRALCFRHCQADSNARTKVIMKRYLFKCIGATVPPASPLGFPPPSRSTNPPSLCTCTSTPTPSLGRQASPFLFRILLSRYHIYGAILPAAIVFLRRYKKRRVRRFSRVSLSPSPLPRHPSIKNRESMSRASRHPSSASFFVFRSIFFFNCAFPSSSP